MVEHVSARKKAQDSLEVGASAMGLFGSADGEVVDSDDHDFTLRIA